MAVDSQNNDASSLTVEPVGIDRWRDLFAQFADANYRQSWEYADATAARHRACVEHVAILGDRQVVGLAAVRIKKVPLIGGGIAYVSGGPLTRGTGEPANASGFVAVACALREEYAQ